MKTFTVERMRCEHVVNPLGVEVPRPRLSWELCGLRRGLRQAAYRLRAASTGARLAAGEGDIWDSGRVESAQSVLVAYAGSRLRSRQRVCWQVEVWDEIGEVATSAPAFWETGLLQARDWSAQWITYTQGGGTVPVDPAPFFRKEFNLDRPVESARAYVCGLGYHEFHLNGKRVGDAVLHPAFTKYDAKALYTVYDVTALLQSGVNAAGLWLGTGWYNCHSAGAWDFAQAPWRDVVKALAQIEVTFKDGSRQTIASDSAWRWSASPIRFDGLREGETYDAREEQPGWATAGFEALEWKPAIIARPPGGALKAMIMPPCRVIQTTAPVARHEALPGVWVFDLGQNMTGWARLTVTGAAGTRIVLRYAEKLSENGEIDDSNIQSFAKGRPFQTDTYILRGDRAEIYEPRFAYHGFQYVQVTGLPEPPTDHTLQGRVVHTDLETTGRFACSSELLTWIQHAVRWATLGNYHGMPTDCPHREKNGWTGDASLSSDQMLYNFDAASSYTKWLDDFTDCQRPNGAFPGIVPTGGWGYNWGAGPAWDAAYFTLSWNLYLYRGDRGILERHYEGMQRYLSFLAGMASGGIVNFGLGDWCPPEGVEDGHACPAALTNTAYYFSFARQTARVAELLGKRVEAARYAKLAARIRRAFLKTFATPLTGMFTGENQTSMATALFHNLVEPPQTDKVLAALLERVTACHEHLECGILGAKYVMRALTDSGHAELAYRIAMQEDYPSWGLWRKLGATTLWETWDGKASQNHHMFSDVGAWLYYALAGIQPDPAQPGFKHAVIRPNLVGELEWVEAGTHTPYGPLSVEWRREAGGAIFEIVVPANTTATVSLPARNAPTVTEGGRLAAGAVGIRISDAHEAGRAVFEVSAGTYEFICEL